MHKENLPMSIAQVASRIGLDPSQVRRLVRNGTLPRRSLGPRGLFLYESDLKLAANRPKRGHPKKSKNL